tara:strand:- start:15565 stop:16083 length:519 start_codon:yes stop_codon:yes gene_type:complete
MNLDTPYLLYIIVPLFIILSGFLIYFISKYRNLQHDHTKLKETHTKFKNKKTDLGDYINKIKHIIQGGNQLRSGFIEDRLVQNQGQSNQFKFKVLVEVKELKRTLKRSKVKVVTSKVMNDSNQSIFPFKTACDMYDGWMDSNKIQWMEIVDGREETINEILKGIEEDESIVD